jgi:hypothetical protein
MKAAKAIQEGRMITAEQVVQEFKELLRTTIDLVTPK